MNYIGIRGHRGAGKKTVAYLLGETLNYILQKKKGDKILNYEEEFKELFKNWCNSIKNNEEIIDNVDLEKVYFENFGDGPKTFVYMLLGCDSKYVYDDYCKDHMIINLKDFTWKFVDDLPEDYGIKAEELYQLFSSKKEPAVILKDTYVTLREFIMYFGHEIMQRYFGLNVWVKSLINNDVKYPVTYNDTNFYKIFADAKFPSEITYIKNNGGLVVKVNRPKYKKKGKDMLKHDDRYDYEVNIGDSLYDLSEPIWDIAIDIINKNIKNGKENK